MTIDPFVFAFWLVFVGLAGVLIGTGFMARMAWRQRVKSCRVCYITSGTWRRN